MHRLLTVLVLLLLTSLSLAAETANTAFARQLVEDSLRLDWDYQQSYLETVCPQHREFLATSAEMKEEWRKGRDYGSDLQILSVQESDEPSSLGVQVDVTAQSPGAERGVVFRFWLKQEDGGLCQNGFNFFTADRQDMPSVSNDQSPATVPAVAGQACVQVGVGEPTIFVEGAPAGGDSPCYALLDGSPNVFFGGKRAVTIGMRVLCPDGRIGQIVGGASSVFVNGQPLATAGSRVEGCE